VFPPGVSLRDQSLYLDEAEYLAWRDPRVRSMGQFLLQDSRPVAGYPPGSSKAWSSFQTGLEFLGGAPKPSLNAYRLPIYLPQTSGHAGVPQWRPPGGSYRAIATVTTTDPSGVLTTRVVAPATGVVRIAWTSGDGKVFYSRGVGVRVGAPTGP
jgi:hypothetical protein